LTSFASHIYLVYITICYFIILLSCFDIMYTYLFKDLKKIKIFLLDENSYWIIILLFPYFFIYWNIPRILLIIIIQKFCKKNWIPTLTIKGVIYSFLWFLFSFLLNIKIIFIHLFIIFINIPIPSTSSYIKKKLLLFFNSRYNNIDSLYLRETCKDHLVFYKWWKDFN
jgi:hypothetical protein